MLPSKLQLLMIHSCLTSLLMRLNCSICRERIHLRHEQPAEAKGGRGGKPKDMSKKAILLSGPPGIGKTSSAMIISRSGNFLQIPVLGFQTPLGTSF